MSSLMTNTAAMTALQTLRTVAENLSTTQNQISTGYRVATASDNSAYWSIATTMRSDNGALSAVSDALGLGAATVDTEYTALTATVGNDTSGLTALKDKLVAAATPGVDRAKIQDDITQIEADLQNTASMAVFNGNNWLSVNSAAPGYNATASIVSSFSRVNGQATINTIQVNVDSVKLYDRNSQTGAVTSLSTTGTFTTAGASSFTITVANSTATQNFTVNTTIGESLSQIVTDLNALNITGVTFSYNTGTSEITVANRAQINNVAAGVTLGNGCGLTGGTMAAPGSLSKKGILDASMDYYDSTSSSWKTTSISSLNISTLTDSANDQVVLQQYINVVDKALKNVTSASAVLGADKTRITTNQDFVKSLSDAVTRGIGQLVDADMNAASTRLQALQVQQQLGIQALSIANSGSQSILSLFK